MAKSIVINLKLNTLDLFRYMLFHSYSGKEGVSVFLISLLALIMTPIAFFGWKAPWLGIAFLLIWGIYLVMVPIQMFLQSKRQATTNPVFQNNLKYRISEQQFEVKQHTGTVRITWENILRLQITPFDYLFYTNKEQAFIIPKNKLSDTDRKELEEFVTNKKNMLNIEKAQREEEGLGLTMFEMLTMNKKEKKASLSLTASEDVISDNSKEIESDSKNQEGSHKKVNKKTKEDRSEKSLLEEVEENEAKDTKEVTKVTEEKEEIETEAQVQQEEKISAQDGLEAEEALSKDFSQDTEESVESLVEYIAEVKTQKILEETQGKQKKEHIDASNATKQNRKKQTKTFQKAQGRKKKGKGRR